MYPTRKSSLVILALGCAALLGPVSPRVAAQDADSAGEAKTEPEFKTDKAAEAWKEGLALWEKREYGDAGKAFKTAYSGAKSKEDKALVKSYRDGVKYAPTLEKVAKMVEDKEFANADKYLSALYAKVEDNAALGRWNEIRATLDVAIYVPIETFDVTTGDYTEKYGKYYIDDEAIVFGGRQCLRWKSTDDGKVGVLKVKSVPKNWEAFQAIEFWVQSSSAIATEVLILTEEGKADPRSRPTPPTPGAKPKDVTAAFQDEARIAGRAGTWVKVRLPLAQFRSQGNATYTGVKDFRIQITGGQRFDFLIDEIRLVRRDPKSAR